MVVATQKTRGWLGELGRHTSSSHGECDRKQCFDILRQTKIGIVGEHGALIYSRTDSWFDSFTELAPLQCGFESNCSQRIADAPGSVVCRPGRVNQTRCFYSATRASGVLNRPRAWARASEIY